jgi:serine/threonine-protein kinase
LKEGHDVSLVVSKGPAPRDVPDLTTMDEATAVQKLKDAGLSAKVDHQNSETVPKGFVVGWTPKGSQARGTEVAVLVSLGPAPVPLSDWAGHTFDEFAANLAKVQVKAARNDVFSDTVAAGKIISTSPPPGTPIPKDGTATVTATVSKGFAPIPSVAGKSVTDATNILTAAGYQVVGVNGPPTHAVSSTNPPAGTPAKKGTQVTLITS